MVVSQHDNQAKLPKSPFFGSDSEFGVGECIGDLSTVDLL
jgi:hypothetical protein